MKTPDHREAETLGDGRLAALPVPGEVWRGVTDASGERCLCAVVHLDGKYSPCFWWNGLWRNPAPDFGYQIMAAWSLDHTKFVAAHEADVRADERAKVLAKLRRHRATWAVPTLIYVTWETAEVLEDIDKLIAAIGGSST